MRKIFNRLYIPFAILLFLAGTWCFTEWQYPIAGFCSGLLLRMNEAPEYTQTPDTQVKKTPAAKRRLVTISNLQMGTRKAGSVVPQKNWNRTVPVFTETNGYGSFIADSCLNDWAMISFASAEAASLPEDIASITCEGGNAVRKEDWGRYLFTDLQGYVQPNKVYTEMPDSDVILLARLEAEQKHEHAKILFSYQAPLLEFYVNGTRIWQNGPKQTGSGNKPLVCNVSLNKGLNTVLVRIRADRRTGRLQMRFVDFEGRPLYFAESPE